MKLTDKDLSNFVPCIRCAGRGWIVKYPNTHPQGKLVICDVCDGLGRIQLYGKGKR